MPLVNREATKRLRDIIERPGSIVVPGGVLPIQAVLAEQTGYEAFHVSGGFYHMWYLGIPDCGLWTTTEFVEHARKIVDAVDIPVFTDTDVCGGNVINIYRTVQDLIHAGVAGCHIEDVQYPKGITKTGLNWRPINGGNHDGELLVSTEEQVGRLKAAIEARDELDPNFVIIARTDARNSQGGSVELAIERAHAYEDAGVDMIMFDGMRTWDECKTALAACRLPAFNSGGGSQVPKDAEGNPIDLPTIEERTAANEKFLLWVGLGWQGALQTAWDQLTAVRKEGFGVIDEWHRNAGKQNGSIVRTDYMNKILDIQRKYLPSA